MAAIGPGWAADAWVEASWTASAWGRVVVVVAGRSVRWYIKDRGRLAGKAVGPARLVPGFISETPVVVPEREPRREAGVGPPPPPVAPLALPGTAPSARRLTAALRDSVAGVAFAEMLAVQADLLAAVPTFRRKPQGPTAEEGPIPGTPPVAEEQDNEISDEDLEMILALVVGL